MDTLQLQKHKGAKALDICRCGVNDGLRKTKYTGNGKSRHEISNLMNKSHQTTNTSHTIYQIRVESIRMTKVKKP